MKKNILSVAISVMMTFSIGVSATAERVKIINSPYTVEYKYSLPATNNDDILIANEETENIQESNTENIEAAKNAPIQNEEQTQSKVRTAEPTVQAKNISNEPTAQNASYSENDIYWLSRLIEAEASGESYQGKAAVGACVMNRVKSSQYPNSVYGVIFDKSYGVQYQPTVNGAINNTPSADSLKAANEALSGNYTANGALYFCSVAVSSGSWAAANRAYCMTIGNHVFYY